MTRLVAIGAGLAGGVLLIGSLTGCSSSTAGSGGAAGVDRASGPAVIVAFAAAYAGGDTPAACELATDRLREKLSGRGLCDGAAPWSQVPQALRLCADDDGSLSALYMVRPEIERFLQFTVTVVPVDGGWAVDNLAHRSPGEPLPACDRKLA